MEITATIIKDSVNEAGNRLTTFVLVYPRFIHPQVLTHRAFSRNTSSSRAIPVNKMIEAAIEADINPLVYGKNKKGMQSSEVLEEISAVKAAWDIGRDTAIAVAKQLSKYSLHKQYANRVLEPYLPITCILSATEFDNFFRLRISDHAQPEIQDLAVKMFKAMGESTPESKKIGELHIPFLLEEESESLSEEHKIMVSVARCARVSYSVPGEAKPSDIVSDITLASKLINDKHLSPTEHMARACGYDKQFANFRGWVQFRSVVERLTFD